ncbi:hypothetical protein NRB20_43760 [Nocardia sp. RB20]|uniref:PknH-like extracellular domain-containing protein n=1 Tax=Nocardia macrotermitis TaxID=2585198 RepID=A0A7K0D683_9NOCA|nr:hypothetical protein [Nocardia macrotermitis]
MLTAAAVFAAGCSSHHDAPSLPAVSAATAPATITAAPLTDSATLQGKLLAGADIPPEFEALDVGPGTDANSPPSTSTNRSHTDPADCAKVLDAVSDQVPGASAHGAVHYSAADFDSIDIDAASYPSSAAAKAFTTVQDLLRRCGSYSGTDADGVAISYQVGGLDEPRAGDASVSFQVRTSSQGLTLYSAATVALVGSTVVQVARAGQKPVDPAALRTLTGTQIQRLQGISGP